MEHLLWEASCSTYIICGVGTIIPTVGVRNWENNLPKDIRIAVGKGRIPIQLQLPPLFIPCGRLDNGPLKMSMSESPAL